jgi:hypothetical protein
MITKSDLIYESPDGGKTVYSRKIGETERTLVHLVDRWIKWKDILKESSEHPALADAITKAEMIYALVKKT